MRSTVTWVCRSVTSASTGKGTPPTIGRACARFGDVPEVRMLVARLELRSEAFVEAEETLAPLTGDANRSRASAAWADRGQPSGAGRHEGREAGERGGARARSDERGGYGRSRRNAVPASSTMTPVTMPTTIQIGTCVPGMSTRS